MNPEEEEPQMPTRVRSPNLNTRLLDNHYDPKIHEKPWIANGVLRDYKYNYSDSGLAFTMNKPLKMKNYKEKHEQNQEIEELNKKSKGFRQFKEYENVTNNEILITIEYCTNCNQHQGSTRHNEEKYLAFANSLKKEIITQYPVVKVVLKPLIVEQCEDATEAAYLRSRLGAFEVQLYSKNSKGEVSKKYVFSKLRTRNWPSISAVVDSLSSFLPTADFVVRLYDPNYDPEEIKEESESSNPPSQKKQENKLKGLAVILRPLRSARKAPFGGQTDMRSSKGMDTSRSGMSRPTSSALRPQSAYSSVSGKSLASAKKGTVKGEENVQSSSEAREFVEQSDAFGVVVFKQIPHNIYELEILESFAYQPEKKVVNIFEMVERGVPLKEEIMMKEQSMGVCVIKLVSNYLPFTDATVIVAKKYPDPSSKTAVLREKEPKSGVYEFMIDPGEYIISITRPGFVEKREELTTTKGRNEFTIQIADAPANYESTPAKPVDRPVSSKAEERPNSRQRPESSKGRSEPQGISKTAAKGNLGMIPQEKFEGSPTQNNKNNAQHNELEAPHEEAKPKERVKSAMVKKIELSVLDIDTGKPLIGADVIVEEIGFKGTTNDQGKCLLPVNKLNCGKLILDHESYFGMVEEYGGEGIDLKSVSEKKFNLIPRPNDIHEIQMRFIPGNSVKCAQFKILSSPEDEESKKDMVVQHLEGGKEVLILKNLLKKHGVFRIVAEITNLNEFLHQESMFLLSHYGDCDQLYVFPPPDKIAASKKLSWDVGFFADPVVNPQFVEINGYSDGEVALSTCLKEYQMLLNYLHNSKSDLKTVLGFRDSRRVEKEGDIFISKEVIYSSLDKYGLEIKNIDHLLSSALSPEGYSLRECERRFASLKPPFNFTKQEGKDEQSDGEDEEYLYEDEDGK